MMLPAYWTAERNGIAHDCEARVQEAAATPGSPEGEARAIGGDR